MTGDFKENLVIGIRLTSKFKNSSSYESLSRNASRYLDYLRVLSPKKIVGITTRGDEFESVLRKKCENVKTLEKDDFGFVKPVESLYKLAEDSYLLIITPSVEIYPWQLQHGYEVMRLNELYSIGWKILSQNNDGSYLGKLSYNTCQLYSPNFYQICEKVGGIPSYVENGVLGTLTVNMSGSEKSIPIGGQEDLALQLKTFKQFGAEGKKLFGHIKHYSLSLPEETGFDITSGEKIFRKIAVAEIYRGLEGVDVTSFLDSWLIM